MLDDSAFRGAKLCVVGNINRDIKTAPVRPGDYLFSDGETSIDGIHETIGGGGANSAAIAAGLGATPSFIGQIGDDETGRRLEQALTRAGVLCHLHKAPHLATGTTVNLVFDSGQRHFLSCHPNNVALSFETLDLAPLASADHLLRADIWFSDAMLYGGNEQLFTAAREAGVPVSIDLNWDPKWGRTGRDEIERRKEAVRRMLPLVDLAHGNACELNEFTGETDLTRSLGRLLEWGVKAVVVHLGSQGAGYFSGAEFLIEPPAPIQRQVMVTGCGDVLSTCMMLLHKRGDISIPEKLRLANRVTAGFMEGKLKLLPHL
jgi:sugar/nucleoside kinase (ribokinase family)